MEEEEEAITRAAGKVLLGSQIDRSRATTI